MCNAITLYNFNAGFIHYCESVGLSKVLLAYAHHAEREAFTMIGFNENTGCVYMVLENGICINSMLGRRVFYSVLLDEEQEQQFNTYQKALDFVEHAEYLRSIQDGTPEAADDIKFEDEGDNPYSISSLF